MFNAPLESLRTEQEYLTENTQTRVKSNDFEV